jgi:uncharacterized damage-inducible protein DinB
MVDAILESWGRQATIVNNVAGLITEDMKMAQSREGEMRVYEHLAHMHGVRRGWMHEIDPKYLEGSATLHTQVSEEEWQASDDLALIKQRLQESALAVRQMMADLLPEGKQAGPYDHPLFYVQHMIWHEGWHIGAIFHALRAAGFEPTDEWEEANVWGLWRTEEL